MNRRSTLALALLLAVSPLSAQEIPARPEQIRFEPLEIELKDPARLRHRLAGGVPVYVVEDHTLPLVDVTVFLRAGAVFDTPGKDGLAALTTSLVRRGGIAGRRPAEVDEKAESLAARIETASRNEHVTVSLNCLSGRLDEGLDLLFEMLRQPAFDPEAIELEKRRMIATMTGRNDDGNRILDREWTWLLYGRDHAVARYTTAPGVASITREDLAGFHARFWKPANMVLAVSGDVDPKALLKGLETRLAGWEKGKAVPWPPAPPSHRPAAGLYSVDRSLPQAQVAIGRLGLTRQDRDRHAASLANQILGGGGAFTTRLMQRLRTEEGLVYGVTSELGVGPLWPEPFQIRFAADPAKVPQAITIARAELQRLCAETPSAEELETAKSQLLAQIADTFGSARKTALAFALGEILGRPHSDWRDDRAGIQAASAAGVQAAACRALSPETMLTLVVGAKLPEPAQQLPLRDPLTLAKP